MQDFFAHYGQGFRANKYSYSKFEVFMAIIAMSDEYNVQDLEYRKMVEQMRKDYPTGHLRASINGFIYPEVSPLPDDSEVYSDAYAQAAHRTRRWYGYWKQCCCEQNGHWIQRVNDSGKPVCEKFKQPVNTFGDKAASPVIPKRPYARGLKESPSALKGTSIII